MKFKIKIKSATAYLFFYFFTLAVIGTILLQLPFFYSAGKAVPLMDALFTTVSAICVTGLSSVDMNVYTTAGFVVIMLLIEAGGLGLVSFFTVYLVFAAKKISLLNRNIIKDYFTDDSEIEARQIVKLIISITLGFQIIGGIILALFLKGEGESQYLFYGFFLAVSAFCNAGFAPYSTNLVQFIHNPGIYITIAVLIIAGGLGFTVITNIYMVFKSKKKTMKMERRILSLHSKIVLFMTSFLILSGTLLFFIIERKHAFVGLNFWEALGNAFFQSVTLRTAGFETVAQKTFSPVSTFISNFFMITGGSPGSMAGGVKTTTIFLIMCIAYKNASDKNLPSVFHRDISEESTEKAVSIFIKAMCFIGLILFLLFIVEKKSLVNGVFSEIDLIFEACSAFGTVGLSRGVTRLLSPLGKVLIILLMFAGRTGITFIALNKMHKEKDLESLTDYPKENVIIG